MLFEMDADILVLLSRFNPALLDPALFDAEFDAALPDLGYQTDAQIPPANVHQSKSSRLMFPMLLRSVFASSLPGKISERMAGHRGRRLRR
jgi:hypothetical protein